MRTLARSIVRGRHDEALQFAFAALDRDPDLYGAYEVAGDAVAIEPHNGLARHFYRAALNGIGQEGRARILAKLAALPRDP
jgi:Tfp pilus assembly protein PilF